MANKKTDFPKEAKPVYIEDSLREFARKESIKRGCFHNRAGSSSEHIRRGYKAWLLLQMPYLKNVMKDVDWSEAY